MLSCDVLIMRPFGRKVRKATLRRVVEEIASAEGITSPTAVSLVIADDETVHELNREWRGMDRTTDVLAFALREGDMAFPSDAEGTTQLGEVIISLPQAERQAKRAGHSLKREIAVLVIHGILHLLGYDHQTTGQRKRMRTREAEILARLGRGDKREKRGHR